MRPDRERVLPRWDDFETRRSIGHRSVWRAGRHLLKLDSNRTGKERGVGKGREKPDNEKRLFYFYFNVVGFIIAQGQCSSHDPQGNRIV